LIVDPFSSVLAYIQCGRVDVAYVQGVRSADCYLVRRVRTAAKEMMRRDKWDGVARRVAVDCDAYLDEREAV
jgi:hypothetical protein